MTQDKGNQMNFLAEYEYTSWEMRLIKKNLESKYRGWPTSNLREWLDLVFIQMDGTDNVLSMLS